MVAVYINGADRTCDIVAGTLNLGLGRQSVREKGQPGYCGFTVAVSGGVFVSAFDTVQVTTADGPRFSGVVAETSLSHDVYGRAWQTVNAVGPLASWGYHFVGEPTWPRETVADRAQRIADVIGAPIVIMGGGTQNVDRQDVDNRRAKELLEELADSCGGFLFDYPTGDGEGTIYLQALDARAVAVSAETWNMEPAGETWDQTDPAVTWASEDANPFMPIDLSGCWVRADPGPVWASQNQIVNRLVTNWGADGGSQNVFEDTASQALYGVHSSTLDTPLDDSADVTALGNLILTRASFPALHFPSIEVETRALPDSVAWQLSAAVPGTRITLNDLPQPAPQAAFLGVIEGWHIVWRGQGDALLRLYVSDVRHSMAVPAWDALPPPPAALWDDEPAGEPWEQELV